MEVIPPARIGRPAAASPSAIVRARAAANDLVDEWVENCPQPAWRRHSDAVNARLLDRWLPAKPLSRLLKTDLFDEAVSEGVFPLLATRASTVSGIDISFKVASSSAAKYPALHALQADVRRLPFEDGSFDAVVSLSTLDHFDSDSAVSEALTEIHRVLAPGGLMILTLDNLTNPVVALRNALPFRLLNRAGLVPYPVGNSFGSFSAARLVRDAGFELTKAGTIMHAPRVAAIPVVEWMSARLGATARNAITHGLMAFERLAAIPTAALTGHFIAIRALKKTGATG